MYFLFTLISSRNSLHEPAPCGYKCIVSLLLTSGVSKARDCISGLTDTQCIDHDGRMAVAKELTSLDNHINDICDRMHLLSRYESINQNTLCLHNPFSQDLL